MAYTHIHTYRHIHSNIGVVYASKSSSQKSLLLLL